MQRFVWNLRHSGFTSDIANPTLITTGARDPLSFKRLIRLRISTLAAFNGAKGQVACKIGQQHVRDNWAKATGTPPYPLQRFESFIKSPHGPDPKSKWSAIA